MKLSKILEPEFGNALNSAGNKTNSLGAFKYREIRKFIEDKAKNFHETRSELIQKCSLKDKYGKPVSVDGDATAVRIDPKKSEEFNKETKSLLNLSLKFPEKLSAKKHFKPESLTGNEVFWLDEIISE